MANRFADTYESENPVLDLYGGSVPAAGGFEETLTNPPAPKVNRFEQTYLPDDPRAERPAPVAAAPAAPADPQGNMVTRGLEALGSTDVARGIHEGLTNRGIGVIQTVYDAMKMAGVADSPELERAFLEAASANHQAAKGSGVGGFVGEVVGDPINWVGGGAVGGATIKGLGKAAAVKKLAMQGARAGAITGAASGATGVRQDGETRLGNTVNTAAQGAVLGAALPAGARAAGITGRGTKAAAGDIIAAGRSGQGRTPEELQAAVQALGDQADTYFSSMRANNVDLTPQGRATMAQAAQDAFKLDRLDATLHPETTSAMRDLMDQLANGVPNAVNPNTRTPFDATAFDMIRRRLINAKGQDGAQAGKLRAAIFDAVQQPGALNGPPDVLDNLNLALQQWQKKARFEDVAGLVEKANSDPNRIRTAVDKFTDDPKNTKGLRPNELEALLRSGKRNAGEKVLGLAGSLGVDMGSISRNPRALVPFMMATTKSAAQGGAGYAVGGPVPVVVGTIANSIRNRIANGKLEKALREIEARPIVAPVRPPAPPAPTLALPAPGYNAGMSPSQIAAAQAQMAAKGASSTAPSSVLPPLSPGSVRPNPNEVFGDVPYATTPAAAAPAPIALPAPGYQAPAINPEIIAPQFSAGRPATAAEMATNKAGRQAMQDVSLTPDVLRAQRRNQITAAEAQKAMQDAAAAMQRTQQVAASATQPTIGDMLQQVQSAAADRAAAVGEQTPALSVIGQALADAIGGGKTAKVPPKRTPTKITISPDPDIGPDGLPRVNLPQAWE